MSAYKCNIQSKWKMPFKDTQNNEKVRYEGVCGTFGGINNGWEGDQKPANYCGKSYCGCYNMVDEVACTGSSDNKWRSYEVVCADSKFPTSKCPYGYVCCNGRPGAVGDSSGNSLGRCRGACNNCGPQVIKIPAQQGVFKEMGVRIYNDIGCNGSYLELIPSIPTSIATEVAGDKLPARGVTFYGSGVIEVNEGMTKTNLSWKYPSFVMREKGKTFLYHNGKATSNIVVPAEPYVRVNVASSSGLSIASYLNNMQSIYVPPHLEVDFIMSDKQSGSCNGLPFTYRFSDFPADGQITSAWSDSIYNPTVRCMSVDKQIAYLKSPPNRPYLRAEDLGKTSPAAIDGDGALGCICPSGALYGVEPAKIIAIVVRPRGTPMYQVDAFSGRLVPVPGDSWVADAFSSIFIRPFLEQEETALPDEVQPLLLMSQSDYEQSNGVVVPPSMNWAMLLYGSSLIIQRSPNVDLVNLLRGFRLWDFKSNKPLASPSDLFFQRYAERQLSSRNVPGAISENPRGAKFMPGSDSRVSCFAGQFGLGGITGTPYYPQCTSASCINRGYKTPDMANTDCTKIAINSCANVIVQDIVGSGKDLRVNAEGQIVDNKTGNLVSNVTLFNDCVFAAEKEYGYDPATGTVARPPEPPAPPIPGASSMMWVYILIIIVVIGILAVVVIVAVRYFKKK
ncbi:hypothetical protein KDA11_05295 [Candidatus Saccharibacteria bacterium]|nr:hypothetical protein [Candidatus Saccharibacteria bacterium]